MAIVETTADSLFGREQDVAALEAFVAQAAGDGGAVLVTGEAGVRKTGASAILLTPQQLEIAQVAARGLTNKQIGERLLLSHRTVGTHLDQLYPKLGITSRAALGDALAQLEAGESRD